MHNCCIHLYLSARISFGLSYINHPPIRSGAQDLWKTKLHHYREKLLRIKGYESYIGLKRPSFVGHWVNDIVYDRIAPGIRKKLKELNPRMESGNRKFKNTQFMTLDHGIPELKEHLSKAMVLMDAATGSKEFDRLLNRSLPKFGETLEIPFRD